MGIHELGTLPHGARCSSIARRKVLHLLRSVVLALQVQARRHGVRRGLAAAGRLRQDRRDDRRKSRYGADEAARPARRVPRQTGVAAFSGDDRRHRDEHPAGRGHLLRHLLHVGRKIFRQRRRRLRLHLQHGGTGARLRERRQNHLDRRRADRRRERHRHDAAADRERPHGRRRARRPRRALRRSPSSNSSTSAARRATKRC